MAFSYLVYDLIALNDGTTNCRMTLPNIEQHLTRGIAISRQVTTNSIGDSVKYFVKSKNQTQVRIRVSLGNL